MAVTQNTYTGDGTTVLFSFTFPYLENTDIKVSLNGVITTAYTLANATTIQFNTAPANGAAVRIYRVTDDATLAATFYPGSAIRSQDLNENFTQNLYVTQESNRDATTAISTASGAVTTANTALSNSTAATSTANTASTNASAAVATANTANSNASAAVSTANTASSNATTAVNTANAATATANSAASNAATALSTANAATSTANAASTAATNAVNTANSASSAASSAVSTANTASTNASNAVTTANTASSNATTAVNTANSAVATANSAAAAVANAVIYTIVANVAAIPGSPTNNTAIEVASSTGIESFTPLAGLPAGFVGNSGLSVRIIYSTSGSTWNWVQYFPNDPEARYLKLAGGTLTGVISPALGTAALPSVAFTGDPNTGIYSPGADQLAVATNSVERIKFGTTEAVVNDGGAGYNFRVEGDTNANLFFVDASTDRVGIGTSTPGKLLEVSSSTDATIRINDPATVGTVDRYIGGVEYYTNDSSGGAKVACSIKGYHVDISGNGRLQFATGNETTAMTINGSQRVGIGTTSPSGPLEVALATNRNVVFTGVDNDYSRFGSVQGGTGNNRNLNVTGENLFFSTGSGSTTSFTERARLDPSGRLLVGTSTARSVATQTWQTQQEGTSFATTGISTTRNSADVFGSYLAFGKSRGTTIGSSTVVSNGDELGTLIFAGADGTDLNSFAALIKVEVDGTPGTDDMPGRIVLSTTADGSATPTERMRVTSAGLVGIGTTSPSDVLHVVGGGRFTGSAASLDAAGAYLDYSSNIARIAGCNPSGGVISFLTNSNAGFNTERARIDSSGRLLVGTSSDTSGGNGNALLQVVPSGPGRILPGRSDGNTAADLTIGAVDFRSFAGSVWESVATITALSDGVSGSGDKPGRLVFSTTADGASSPTEALRITNDRVVCYNQPDVTSKSTAATLTIAELKTGIIQYTGTAQTLTLPTGTLMEGGFSGIYTNMTFEWSVINTGSGTCTIGAGTAHTIVGGATVTAGASGRFASRRTAANTFVSYRLS